MKRTRSGCEVKEVCSYLVLELLGGGKRLARRELIRGIARRTAENRSFRSNGVLRVAGSDMAEVLAGLEARGWISRVRCRGSRAQGRSSEAQGRSRTEVRWRLTRRGLRARRRLAAEAEKRAGAKESAARRLLGLLGGPPRRGWVLDVGTGEGFLAFKMARRGFRVLGVDSGAFDYSKDSIGRAREKARSFGGRVEFCQADVLRVSEGVCGGRLPRRFELVTASQAVHCMAEQDRCLGAVFDLLKPGGRFLAMDFSVGVEGFLSHGVHCLLAPTKGEWVELLGGVGFAEIAFYPIRDYLVVETRKPRRAALTACTPAGPGYH